MDYMIMSGFVIEVEERNYNYKEYGKNRLTFYYDALQKISILNKEKGERLIENFNSNYHTNLPKKSFTDSKSKNSQWIKMLVKVYEVLKLFAFRESCAEKRLYSTLKAWERNHPITAIIICTILGAIFLNLIAGIILEAFIRFYWN